MSLDQRLTAIEHKLNELLSSDSGTLTFNLTDRFGKNSFIRATKATDAYLALLDISNEVFRPARKHGYPGDCISNLIDQCPTIKDDEGHEVNVGQEIIHQLEVMFSDILDSRGIDFNNLD